MDGELKGFSLRPGDWTTVTRIIVSMVSAMLLSAAALVMAWILDVVYHRNGDEYVLISFLLAGGVELMLISMIWKPVDSRRRMAAFVRPTALTAAIAGVTALACMLADEAIHRNEEFIIGAVCLVAAAAVLLLWMPVLNRLFVGRRIVNEDDQINVNCPNCGYSLVGLNDLRCPECGTSFTIDQLIRSQNYGGVGRTWRVINRPPDDPDQPSKPLSGAS